MKKVLLFLLALVAANAVLAQINPVKWSYEAKKVSANEYDLVFTANITEGWYIYSQTLESDGGPIPTSFQWGNNPNMQLVGKTEEAGNRHEGYDEIFEMNVVKYSGKPTFTQRVKTSGPVSFSATVEYMTCDKDRCLPPTDVEAKFNLQ